VACRRPIGIDFDTFRIDNINGNIGAIRGIGDCLHFLFGIVGIQKTFRKEDPTFFRPGMSWYANRWPAEPQKTARA